MTARTAVERNREHRARQEADGSVLLQVRLSPRAQAALEKIIGDSAMTKQAAVNAALLAYARKLTAAGRRANRISA